MNSLKHIEKSINSLQGEQPPLFICQEGNGAISDLIKAKLNLKYPLKDFNKDDAISPNHVYLVSFNESKDDLLHRLQDKKVSISSFGIITPSAFDWSTTFKHKQLLLEDIDGQGFVEQSDDLFPWTSFAHVGTEFLGEK
jgi:hypothetical protein